MSVYSDITVVTNEKPYTLTANPQIIYAYGAQHIIPRYKTVIINNRMHIWINTALHPWRNGVIPAAAIEVMSSVWIIISHSYNDFIPNGSIRLTSPLPGREGRTWLASSTLGPEEVTVTVLEADRAETFEDFLPLNMNIQQFIRNNAMMLPVSDNIDNCIKQILDVDRERRQDAGGVVDLTGYQHLHSMLESLHNRLLSLEKRFSHDPTVTLSGHLFSPGGQRKGWC